jgi:hypothetical protein
MPRPADYDRTVTRVIVGTGTPGGHQALWWLMETKHAPTYGVAVRTLDRTDGNGMTVVFVDAEDSLAAERAARRIAERRFGCSVLVEHAVLWPRTPAPEPA